MKQSLSLSLPLYQRNQLPSEQEFFQKARDIVHYFFGLDLSLIELVKLKEYTHETLEGLLQTQTRPHTFNPATEAVARFFIFEYGIPFGDRSLINTIEGDIDKPLCEYLRREQEERHFP